MSQLIAGTAAKDYYELLGVPKNATSGEIRSAFRKAALENHPDRGGDADLFQAINKAYDVLSDSERRKYYERTGRLEKSVEEEFLEGFGKKGKKQTAGEQQHAPVDNSEALAERFTDLAEQSHSKSFDAWMRSRDQKSMTLTQDHFMTKEYLVGDTYEKEPIPADAKATTVTARSTGPDLSANTAIGRTRLPKELEWRELLVNVAAAPLSPLDQYVGRAGASALMNEDVDLKTPHTLGFAGIGIVEAVGEGCKDVTVGDWVLPNRDGLGTFTSLTVWDEADVMKVPKELMPLEYMAVHRELCVAYYLLEEYSSTLKPGDACIVNAANGTVGQAIVQLCRLMNIRCIAVVRRHDNFDDTKAWLKFLGAAKVYCDDESVHGAIKGEYQTLPKLAFDGLGGTAALKLIQALQPGGQLVSYGFMGERLMSLPWQVVINRRVTITGFSLMNWIKESKENKARMVDMLKQLAKLVNATKLRLSLEERSLDEWPAAAKLCAESGRNTKIVFRTRSLAEERAKEQDLKAQAVAEADAARALHEQLLTRQRALFTGGPFAGADVSNVTGVNPSAEHTGTIIFLHGPGELPQEYTVMFERNLLREKPGMKLVLPGPQPKRKLTADPSEWFDCSNRKWRDLNQNLGASSVDVPFDQKSVEMLDQLEESCNWIGAIVEAEMEEIDPRKIILCGFSQGGVVAAYTAYTKLSMPIGGVVAVGCPVLLPHLLARKVQKPLSGTSLYLQTGSTDQIHDGAAVKSAAETLRRAIPSAAVETVPGGVHEVGPTEISHISSIHDMLAKLKR